MKATNQPRWDTDKRNYVYEDKPTGMHRTDKIVLTTCILAGIALAIILKIWG